MSREGVPAGLLLEEIRVGDLDAQIRGTGGGEIPVKFHGPGAVSIRKPRADASLDKRQRQWIGAASAFKINRRRGRVTSGLCQNAKRELQTRTPRGGQQ